MTITLIAAVARNRAIGNDNKLLYWLPNDMKRFRALTTGHTIVMGRRTFESLPKGALPNRRNIVLTRGALRASAESITLSAENVVQSGTRFPGCDVYGSLEEALSHCGADEELYIIGGASVYEQALPLADRLCLTEVDDTPAAADAFFPAYDDWQETWREDHPADEKHAYKYSFVDYKQKK